MTIGERECLYGIPIADWVSRTSTKMKRGAVAKRGDWTGFWTDAYRELGGRRESCGNKPCPRAAAYGLWFLGRIRATGRPRLRWTVPTVRKELGKNAAYAVIAADLYATNQSRSLKETWQAVRRDFRKQTGEEAARSEQGEVKVALALAADRLLS